MSERGGRILTPDQRLRVFVSSTLQELAPEREAARDAVASLRLTPVLFELGARPHPPRELYRSYLEQSQVFVGLYWESYGWVAPDETVSGIEDEYLASRSMPRLLYVKEPASGRERRLQEFLARVKAEDSASYKRFGTAAQLGELLAGDLALVLTERFQLTVETRSPPAVTVSSLPVPRTSFVGRGAELAELERFVDSGARLLTLTGAGGIGKTRLAVEGARRLADRYEDGVVFVGLDGVEAAELVPAAIAKALGAREPVADALEAVIGVLLGRELLLVLDNFEHVMAAAPLIAVLLEQAPRLTVLATSREVLRLTGERELQVLPLDAQDDAAMLFCERAAAVRPSFRLSAEEAPVVAQICRRLDGVPLAIELAAPRMRALTTGQLLERLNKRLALQAPRDAPPRQQTLQAAIAWSYDLLGEGERLLLERLGVFHGSFTIDAAEAIAALPEQSDLVELLQSLLEKSVVQRLSGYGETRLWMLRMIREFALDRLIEAGELEPTLERFDRYYLKLARRAEDGLRSGSQRQWKQTLDLEADNLRAALTRAAEKPGGAELVGLMRGLWLWVVLHGNFDEARTWIDQAWKVTKELDDRDRGWLLGLDGMMAVFQGDFAPGTRKLTEAVPLITAAGDRRGAATMKLVLAFGSAPAQGEQSAQAQLTECLTEFEELDDLSGIGSTLHTMCRLRTIYDDYDGAGDLFDRALAAVQRTGDDLGVALALINLAWAKLAGGDTAGCRAVVARLLDHLRSQGITYAGEEALEILARMAHARGEYERATSLLAAADGLRQRLHIPRWPPAQARHDRQLAALRHSIPGLAFADAYANGTALATRDVPAIVSQLIPFDHTPIPT